MVHVNELSKKNRKVEILSNITFHVEPGEILGIGGRNGAGKSILLQILAGLIKPTSGSVVVAGHDVAHESNEVKRNVGYVGRQPVGYGDSLVEEYLAFWASAHGLPKDACRSVVKEGIDLCDLGAVRQIPLCRLSDGLRQRVELARAVLHDPAVMLFDDPLRLLDTLGAAEWIDIIGELAALGKTIIVASSQLWQWFSVVHRLCFLRAGRVVALGTLEELWNRYQIPYLSWARFSEGEIDSDKLAAMESVIDVLPVRGGVQLRYTIPPEQLLLRLTQQGWLVSEFGSDWQGLEQAFLMAMDDSSQ